MFSISRDRLGSRCDSLVDTTILPRALSIDDDIGHNEYQISKYTALPILLIHYRTQKHFHHRESVREEMIAEVSKILEACKT
jgi:hypothetical protein